MARDRFGFLERHGASSPVRFLVAFAAAPDLLLFAKDLLFGAIVAIVAAGCLNDEEVSPVGSLSLS